MQKLRYERIAAWTALFQERIGYYCVDCGCKNPIVLEFHHLDPSTKSFKISDKKQQAITAQRIKEVLEEARKCVVLCANCHRIRHHTQTLTKWTTGSG